MTPTALLVDDEAALLEYLRHQLNTVWPELKIVGSVQNGRQGLVAVAKFQPDIVFLDIHMPSINGLQVAEQIGSITTHCQIVFVTAFDKYAVSAFDAAAIDYLLKPITSARLRQTRERIESRIDEPNRRILKRLLIELGNSPGNNLGNNPEYNLEQGSEYFLQWIRVGKGETVQLIQVSAVVYFQAVHKYTSMFTANAEHLIRMSVMELAERLNPQQFWRIHRGTIVRIEEIRTAHRDLRRHYSLTLKSHPEKLRTSQTYAPVQTNVINSRYTANRDSARNPLYVALAENPTP